MPGSAPVPAAPEGIAGAECLHALREVRPVSLEQVMRVVGHEDLGEQRPPGADDGAVQAVDEVSAFNLVVHDLLLDAAAGSDMVDGVSDTRCGVVGHSARITASERVVKNSMKAQSDSKMSWAS